MNADDATKAWLKAELVALLGFPEVDDILNYVLSEFKTPQEVEPYLTELLGVPATRAKSISSRLFATSAKAATPTSAQGKQSKKQQQQKGNDKQTQAHAQAQSQAQAAPLVPKPAAPNSRLKPAKIKKPSKLLHARIINCLKCGKIEMNGARRCAFCDNELRYEELDDDMMDPAAQQHMEKLVGFDESGAERTTVLDTEEVFYDQVQSAHGDEGRHRQPIVLNLDLELRSFSTVEAPSLVLTSNQELNKDARDLLLNIQKKLTKGSSARTQHTSTGDHSSSRADAVVIEDEYNALYV